MEDPSTASNPPMARPLEAGHLTEGSPSDSSLSAAPDTTSPPTTTPVTTTQPVELPIVFTGAELDAMVLPPLVPLVPGLLLPGLSLAAAPPKGGKSWFALHLCLTVAAGGTFLGHHIEQGDAFYLALEDRHRRLQDRSRKLTKNTAIPANITFAIDAPKLNDGLINMIEAWRVTAANPRLVVIDTLTYVMPDKKRGQSDYDAANAALKELHQYALKHQLVILVIHHTRKPITSANSGPGDPMHEVIGSTGITSPMDTVLVFKRGRNQNDAVLHVMGKDVIERDLNLAFDPDTCIWTDTRPDPAASLAPEQRAVYDAICAGNHTVPDIQAATGKNRTNVNNVLKILHDRGLVNHEPRGPYTPTTPAQALTPPATEHASDKRDIDDIIAEFLAEADQDANTDLPN